MSEYGKDIKPGVSVELSPHLDLWARGARHGTVVAILEGYASVAMDHPQIKRLVRIRIEDLKRN